MPIQIGHQPDHGFDEPLGLLSDCHRRIERFLEVLIITTQRLEGGALSDGERRDLEASLKYFTSAAPMHTADEEQSLFPRLREATGPAAEKALALLARLEGDHDDADRHHEGANALVRRWLAQGTLEPGDLRELLAHLDALRAIYQEHIGLEDTSLFPAAARLLTPEDIRAIGKEMAARRRAR